MSRQLVYIPIIVLVILLGLASRKFQETLPEFITLHFGDLLWASMIYFIFRILLFKKPMILSALLALSFSLFIELSQLYQAPWINALRSTTIGALVLGSGFLWIDLVRYLSGVVLAFFSDLLLANRMLKQKT